MFPTRQALYKVDKLKVRPRKETLPPPCATELSALLNCFASSSDLMASAACADASKTLAACMANKASRPKPKKSTINYHLSRLSKSS